jgi:hypothetical protein
MAEQNEEMEIIKLDGSMGLGENALFTVITKDDVLGDKEETFVFPYALINFDILAKFLTLRCISGYKVVRQPAPPKEG